MNMVTVMTMKTMTMMTKLNKEVGNHGQETKIFRVLTEICYIDVFLSGGRDGGADGEQHQFGEQFLFWGEKR